MTEQTNTYLISTVIVGIIVILVRKVYEYYMTKRNLTKTKKKVGEDIENQKKFIQEILMSVEKSINEVIKNEKNATMSILADLTNKIERTNPSPSPSV